MSSTYSHSVIDPKPLQGDFEYVVCDYCGRDDGVTLQTLQPLHLLPFPMHRLGASVLDTGDTPIKFVQCNNCSLVYMNPRPTEDAIARFYDTVYSAEGMAEGFESNQTARTQYLFDITLSHLDDGPAPSILDIGCGRGQFLYTAQSHGWTVHGSELSAVAAQAASDNLGGVPIHVGDFREMDLAPASLDVVSLLEVIEHLRAPVDYLQAATALVRPNGILLIEVPNVDSWEYHTARLLRQDYRGFTIEHLYYFTSVTLPRILADLDMSVVQMSSRHATSQLPNPLVDVMTMMGIGTSSSPETTNDTESAPSVSVPPLPPVSLPKRIVRQLNNYLMDVISYASQGKHDNPKPSGNTLYLWARKNG